MVSAKALGMRMQRDAMSSESLMPFMGDMMAPW